jgi:hypothetical protein
MIALNVASRGTVFSDLGLENADEPAANAKMATLGTRIRRSVRKSV